MGTEVLEGVVVAVATGVRVGVGAIHTTESFGLLLPGCPDC